MLNNELYNFGVLAFE